MSFPARFARLLLWAVLFVPVFSLQAQSPVVDRAAMDQTVREALRTARRGSASSQSAGASLLPSIDPNEIDLLDREFGLQGITGLIQRKPEQFLLSLETSGFFTSNAALVPGPERSDWVGRPGLRGAWFPKLSDDINLLAMAAYSLWRYADLQELDFDDFSSQLGLQYNRGRGQLPGGMSRLNGWLQYRYQRLTSPWNWGSRLYETHFLEAGLRKSWALATDVTAWVGGNTAFSVEGAPGMFRRHEHSAQIGALWQISPRFSLTGLYRFAWFDYAEVSRDDLNHLLFVGLGCQVTSGLRADFYVSGIFNHSDINAFDYQALNTGVSVVVSHAW